MVRHVHTGLSLGYVLNKMTPSTFLSQIIFKISFNIILPSTSVYLLFPSGFSTLILFASNLLRK